MSFRLLFITFLSCLVVSSVSFLSIHRFTDNRRSNSLHLNGATTGDNMGENQMSVDELKAELDMRGINFDDCISKNELVDRLVATRASGKANPDILKQFNNMQDDPDAMSSSVFDDQDIVGKVQSADGALPGGLPPQMAKALASDPEIMAMLKDPKMQEIISAVMEGGPDGMKKYLSDPDAMILIQKLSKAINRATNN